MAGRMHACVLVPLLMVPGLCVAQRYVPPPPPLTVDPCVVRVVPPGSVAVDSKAKAPVCPPPAAPAAPVPGGAAPSAAEKFPFPGSAPAKVEGKPSAAEKFPYPGSATPDGAAPGSPVPGGVAPQVPAAAAKTTAPASGSGDQFPYPGETSKSPDAVPEGDTPRYVPDSPAPGEKGLPAASAPADDGSSSSSSSSSSGGDPGSAPADAAPAGDKAADGDAGGDTRSAKGRRRLPKVSAQSADERVAEDLNVAKFYSDHGNYQAAYLRGKDATTIMPNDPEGHFILAEAARRLQKKDEAAAEYALYLKLDPGGDKMVAAERALAQLR